MRQIDRSQVTQANEHIRAQFSDGVVIGVDLGEAGLQSLSVHPHQIVVADVKMA